MPYQADERDLDTSGPEGLAEAAMEDTDPELFSNDPEELAYLSEKTSASIHGSLVGVQDLVATLQELVDSTEELIAVGSWLLQRVTLAEREMLMSLCEVMGSFRPAIQVAESLLDIVGTPEEANRAILHVDWILFKNPLDNILEGLDDPNVDAIIYLLSSEILGSGLRSGQDNLTQARDHLEQLKASIPDSERNSACTLQKRSS